MKYQVRYYDAKLSKKGKGTQFAAGTAVTGLRAAMSFETRAEAEEFASRNQIYSMPCKVELVAEEGDDTRMQALQFEVQRLTGQLNAARMDPEALRMGASERDDGTKRVWTDKGESMTLLADTDLFLVLRHSYDPWDKGANDSWVPVGWATSETEADRAAKRLNETTRAKHKVVKVHRVCA